MILRDIGLHQPQANIRLTSPTSAACQTNGFRRRNERRLTTNPTEIAGPEPARPPALRHECQRGDEQRCLLNTVNRLRP